MAHKNKSNFSPLKPKNGFRRGQGSGHKKPEQIFSADEANNRLYDLFLRHGLEWISHSQRQKLAEFYVLLMKNQQEENFTRLVTLRDVGIRHFVDCLYITQLTSFQFPLLDVGSGPGFPGIPLKICYPHQPIFLAEGVQRRVEFLKKVRSDLNLTNLGIFGRNINPFFAYPVSGVITRAVEDIRNTLKNVLTALQTGGQVYFMKGPGVDPEIELAQKELGTFYSLTKDIAYTLPNTQHERRLLIYTKTQTAPLIDFEDEPWPEDT
jgi:16S rRNA (guanine527-N7)-methyltransferase